MSTTTLHHHYRWRALTELEAAIARAEAVAARRRLESGRVEADGRRAARSRALLHLAEADLARLRRSRAALLADEAR